MESINNDPNPPREKAQKAEGMTAKIWGRMQIWGSIIIALQGLIIMMLWDLLISLPLETLWPTITMTTVVFLQGYMIWQFCGAGLLCLLGIGVLVQKAYQKHKLIVYIQEIFIIIGFTLLPFGPIFAYRNYLLVKRLRIKGNFDTILEKSRWIVILMTILTNLVIGAIGIAAGFLIKEQQVDLVYPLFTPQTLPVFRIVGIFFCGVAIMDIIIAIVKKLRTNPQKLKVANRLYQILNLIAFPMGTFLVFQ